MPTQLPKFSRPHVDGTLRRGKTNPHLLFYRYLKGSQSQNRNEKKNVEILKDEFLPRTDVSMLNALRARQNAALEQWAKNHRGGKVCSATFELLGRMVVGMGISSSFENGMLLDWVHGTPFINGEAVKGATRSFGWEQIKDVCQTDENVRKEFQDIFGTVEKQEDKPKNIFRGNVLFFNAYPETNTNLFDVDIITCHYGPYYTGSPVEAPGDWHNPNPVAFLTIREGVKFRFSVASLDESLALKAMEWLKKALVQRGMGAKKRVGYGHFALVEGAKKDKKKVGPGDVQSGLMMKLLNTQASQLPGMVKDLAKEIDALTAVEEKREHANALMGRFNKTQRKKYRNKSWMIKLKTILGEQP